MDKKRKTILKHIAKSAQSLSKSIEKLAKKMNNGAKIIAK